MLTRILASIAFLASAALSVSAQCSQWTDQFHPPGLFAPGNAIARAMAVYDDGSGPALFVAGGFSLAGEQSVSHVAKWDGTAWSALGAGTNDQIHALAVYDDGSGAKLYAAGEFTLAGGVPANRIARWDGSNWSALGTGLNNDALSLVVHDDGTGPALFVGGRFTQAGGLVSRRVARWDGAWSAVAGGPTVGAINALESFDDGSGSKLYAGGSQSWLARWDGSAWTQLTMTGFSSAVLALEVHDDGTGPALFAGGGFPSIDGVVLAGLARWTGTTWQPVGTGAPSGAEALLSFDDGSGRALYVASSQSVSKWTLATGWASVGTNFGGSVQSFAVFDDGSGARLHAGGQFDGAGVEGLWSVARFEAGTWVPLTQDGQGVKGPIRAFVQGDLGGGDELYAGGSFTVAGTSFTRGVAAWDGARWNNLGSGLYGNASALAMHDDGSGTKLYVGGVNLLDQTPLAIASWNGTNWSQVGAGLFGTSFFHGGVFTLASFDDGSGPALYAGGDLVVGNSQPAFAARWNGSQWQALPFDDLVVRMKVLDDGTGPALYACGWFTSVGGASVPNVARWNGSSWTALGAGPVGTDGAAVAMEVFDDGSGPALYAASTRILALNNVERALSRWNGSSWIDLPSIPGFAISALQSWDDGSGAGLYASGVMDFGFSGPLVRVWQNGYWSEVPDAPVGTQSAGSVGEMFVHADGSPHGAMWIGGSFTQTGAHLAFGVARYVPTGSTTCLCDTVTYCTSGTTSSGCVPSIHGIGVATPNNSTDFTLQVTGVEGGKSGHLFYGISGPHAATWGQSTHFLCVKAPTQRTGTQSTGGTAGQCDGSLTLDWDQYVATHPGALGMPFGAGQYVWVQSYFRDPGTSKTTALSNALRFALCP